MREQMSRRAATHLLLAGSAAATELFARQSDSTQESEISPKDPHPRKRVKVLDSEMSFVDVGKGDPIVFLHGNPTSSYLWRNIISQVKGSGRCLAPDLVGMGKSKPSPDKTYRVLDHARYLDAWFEAVGATNNVTLVIHDWGSVLGFHRAARYPAQIKSIAYMEALVMDRTWAEFGPFEQTFRALRSPAGEKMVLDQNLFVEEVLPHAILRKITKQELDAYRAPFKTRESRLPTLVFPREIPVDGEPADVASIMLESGRYLSTSKVPKLYFNVEPGTMPPRAREFCKTFPNQREITVKGIHYVQEDSPREISSALLDFLKNA